MNRIRILNHRLTNLVHTLALIGAMLGLLAAVGFLLGGSTGLFWASVIGGLLLFFSRRAPSGILLRMYGARGLSEREAPVAYALLRDLAHRAGLENLPRLYYLPNRTTHAFTVGDRDNAAIAIAEGLFRRFSRRELAGILAHEISHIRSNDMQVLRFAEIVHRSTRLLSVFGQFLLFLNLPLLLLGRLTISWFAILLLIAAPLVSGLLQLALSRAREFDADLGAVRLTGDPRGLALALEKLEYFNSRGLWRALIPGYDGAGSSLFRTHPQTRARVERLLGLVTPEPWTSTGLGSSAA